MPSAPNPADRNWFATKIEAAQRDIAKDRWRPFVALVADEAKRARLPRSAIPDLQNIAVALVRAVQDEPMRAAGDLRGDKKKRLGQIEGLISGLEGDRRGALPYYKLYNPTPSNIESLYDQALGPLKALRDALMAGSIPAQPRGARESPHSIAVHHVVELCQRYSPKMEQRVVVELCRHILTKALELARLTPSNIDWPGRVRKALKKI